MRISDWSSDVCSSDLVVAREKAIDRDVVLMAMEDAIQKAARSRYGLENDIHAEIDRKSGEIRLARHLQVVDKIENDAIEIGVTAAQRRNPDAQVGDVIAETLPPMDRSEGHTSEPRSLMRRSYASFG